MSPPATKLMFTMSEVPLTKTACKRCSKSFSYYRRGRHRYYCEPCKELERKDANTFHNGLNRIKREAARVNAYLAHVEAEEA